MAKTSFYLNATVNNEGEQLIMMTFCYECKRFRYSTAQTINEKFWNENECEPRKNFLHQKALSKLLDKFKTDVNEIYLNAKTNGVEVDNTYLKMHMDKKVKLYSPESSAPAVEQKPEPEQISFIDALTEFCDLYKATRKKGTWKKYNCMRNHVINFSKKCSWELDLKTVNLTMYERLLKYYIGLELDNVTTFRQIKYIKTFLFWADEKEYFTFRKTKSWKVKSQEKMVNSITENELWHLFNFEITEEKIKAHFDKLDKEERVYEKRFDVKPMYNIKKMFLFSCFTSQRFSDVTNIDNATINHDQLDYTSIKTGGIVHGILNEHAIEILEEYDYVFPKFTDQYANRVLHHLAEMAGLDRTINKVKFIGKERIDYKQPLWQALTFHWGRKAFATISGKNGMRIETRMAQGHWSDFKSFKRYNEVNRDMIV